MEIFDISVPIRDGMLHYAGNPPVHVTRVSSLEAGDPANVSELDLGAHTGTHVDAPDHFLVGGAGAESLPLEALIGPAEVVDAGAATVALDLLTLRNLELPPRGSERILFKTRNSQLWSRDEFTRDFVRLDGEAAAFLVERGAKLLGIDYLSIGDADAHRVLLSAGVVCVEGLDLRGIEPGSYELVCLPLKLVGSDGAPARAVLIR
ncbi:MAG: cyclase family protein [Gaiellaceae bacterium]